MADPRFDLHSRTYMYPSMNMYSNDATSSYMPGIQFGVSPSPVEMSSARTITQGLKPISSTQESPYTYPNQIPIMKRDESNYLPLPQNTPSYYPTRNGYPQGIFMSNTQQPPDVNASQARSLFSQPQESISSLSNRFPQNQPPITPSKSTIALNPFVSYSLDTLGVADMEKGSLKKVYPGPLFKKDPPCEWNNDSLSLKCIRNYSPIDSNSIRSFSIQLLVYIFYERPREWLQILAAQELYNRNYIYHKVKRIWYKRNQSSAYYSNSICSEVLDMNSLKFVSCNEQVKSTDILTIAELNEIISKLME